MSVGGDGRDRGSDDRPKVPTSDVDRRRRTNDAEMECEGRDSMGWMEGMGKGEMYSLCEA